jgi:hypothetical protein
MGKFLKVLNKALSRYDLKITKLSNDFLVDIEGEKEFQELYSFCAPFTMTSIERMYSLYNSIKYIINNNIDGDIVECGIWRGGSAMLIAKYLKIKNIRNRKIYLYDTYEGMPKPSENDTNFIGENAIVEFSKKSIGDNSSSWCAATIEEVKKNIYSTGFEEDNIVFIKGKVEKTIPNMLPEDKIAILRLDTDWYESTKHELIHLYPLLVDNGVLIIDDFGHWDGAKKAVIEYFNETNQKIFLNRIDYTGRIGIKTSANSGS